MKRAPPQDWMPEIQAYALAALTWIVINPEWSIPIGIYLLANIAPRRPPQNPTLRRLWGAMERFMFLAWDKWGGKLKALGFVIPGPREMPTKPDTPGPK